MDEALFMTREAERMQSTTQDASNTNGLPMTVTMMPGLVDGVSQSQWFPDSDFFTSESCPQCRPMVSWCIRPRKLASTFRRSAVRDCLVCRLIWAAVNNFVPQDKRKSCEVSLSGCIQLFIESQTAAICIETFLMQRSLKPWSDMEVKDRLSESTRSQESWDWAKSRLVNCELNHPRCSPKRETLPTRLVDLEPRKDSMAIKVVDVTSEMDNEDFRYACLSHCWGGGCSIKTTAANIQRQREGIPFADIPKTYAHAIQFLRWLGLRYVWIDSLCIIQDDTEDWVREAANMGSIYAGAYLTVAATGAPNNGAGCFVDRPEVKIPKPVDPNRRQKVHKEKNPHIRMMNAFAEGEACANAEGSSAVSGEDLSSPPKSSAREVVMIHLRKHIEHWEFWHDPRSGEGVKRSDRSLLPLLTRGWVYQERSLSRRLLHFTQEELVWECMSQTACECSIASPSRQAIKSGLSRFLFQPAQIADEWRRVVRDYSSKNLTKCADRLPAISALAKHFQTMKPKAMYMAGLWSDTMSRDLMWYAPCPAEPDTSTWRLPYWSWIRAMMPVAWHPWDATQRTTTECTSGEIKLATSDPTGAVVNARILVRGRMAQIHSIKKEDVRHDGTIDTGTYGRLPAYHKTYIVTLKETLDAYPETKWRVTCYWDVGFEPTYEHPPDMHLLKMSHGSLDMKFLILMALGDQCARLGLGTYQWKEKGEDWFSKCEVNNYCLI